MSELYYGILVLSLAIVILFLTAFPFMWMRNYAVVKALTITKPITYWTSLILMMFVCGFLVGSRSSN